MTVVIFLCWLALLGSAFGVSSALVPEGGIAPLSITASHAVVFALAFLHLAGLARGTSSRATKTLRDLLPNEVELALYAPSGVLLSLLPWMPHALAQAALGLLALWFLTSRASRDPLEPRLDEKGRGRWELSALATLFTALMTGAHYLSIASEMASNRQNDAAYYHGVARWIARTGTLDEPIVWHFLTHPDHVVHPAFDYWQGLTSICLALPMMLFGGTHQVATHAMAFLSGGSVLLFAYLVTRAQPLRHHALQLAAVLAFGFSIPMQSFRFDTETPVVFHVVLLASLIAFARQRWVLASCFAFLCFLTRTDGAVTTGLLALLFVVRARRDRASLAKIAGSFASLAGLYFTTNLIRFGTPTPPGSSRAPSLQSYLDLYVWNRSAENPSLSAFLETRLTESAMQEATMRAFDASETSAYVLDHLWLMGLLVLGVLVFFMPRKDASWLVRGALLITVVASFVIPWLSPIVFSRGRTFHPLIPVMCLATFGVVAVLSRTQVGLLRRMQRTQLARTGQVAWLASTALLVTLHFIHPYRPIALTHVGYEAELAAMSEVLGGEVVGTNSPWWVIANTESPAVLLPFESDQAVLEVLERYEVRYLLFTTTDMDSWGPGSWALWSRLRDPQHSVLGPFSFTRVASSPGLIVLRVERIP